MLHKCAAIYLRRLASRTRPLGTRSLLSQHSHLSVIASRTFTAAKPQQIINQIIAIAIASGSCADSIFSPQPSALRLYICLVLYFIAELDSKYIYLRPISYVEATECHRCPLPAVHSGGVAEVLAHCFSIYSIRTNLGTAVAVWDVDAFQWLSRRKACYIILSLIVSTKCQHELN